MPNDNFELRSDAASGPSRAPFAITPDDNVELSILPKAIYVGSGGDVVLRGVDSTADVVFRNIGNGQILDVRASHVRASGTSASDLIGLA